ncbi:anti-sigma factor family protein [Neorhizobium petrolearium]|uniref:Anti-sigma factor n=1 Tax=Neorhizobium petrolearium TaxID=515361 RepID=A0ABY8M8G8_9HYPH|nr:anti-sigma factor [Neorhizobium petrolearium]MCC2610706.1 anti-sigma factor [Neorhizobium petrolearium]WGI70833.1 anti-sigma factor [Neorhizobium petrolearium]
MGAFKPSPLELQLSAYIDGQATERDRQDVEELLVNDPQARALHDALKHGAETGRRAFEDMLKEPVPLDLVRAIRNAALPRKAIRLPHAPHPTLSFKPSGPQIAAACLVLFLLGGGIGYLVGARPVASETALISATAANSRDWVDDVIAHYRLYARQTNHLAEIPAERPADILEWLTTNTGVGFRIPDLSDSGLTFQGARLFPAGDVPVGQLLYRRTDGDGDGDVVAISFTKTRLEGNRSIEEIRNDTGLVSWVTPLATYMVVGPSSAADLDDIAAKAAGLI